MRTMSSTATVCRFDHLFIRTPDQIAGANRQGSVQCLSSRCYLAHVSASRGRRGSSGQGSGCPDERANPVMPRAGHIALIIPHFAARKIRPGDIGIYEYLGNGDWRLHACPEGFEPVCVDLVSTRVFDFDRLRQTSLTGWSGALFRLKYRQRRRLHWMSRPRVTLLAQKFKS
jgi:hypothetical protein